MSTISWYAQYDSQQEEDLKQQFQMMWLLLLGYEILWHTQSHEKQESVHQSMQYMLSGDDLQQRWQEGMILIQELCKNTRVNNSQICLHLCWWRIFMNSIHTVKPRREHSSTMSDAQRALMLACCCSEWPVSLIWSNWWLKGSLLDGE